MSSNATTAAQCVSPTTAAGQRERFSLPFGAGPVRQGASSPVVPLRQPEEYANAIAVGEGCTGKSQSQRQLQSPSKDYSREDRAIEGCPFRKSDPVWIRMIGQNHRIVESDVFDPAHTRSIRCRPGQLPQPA